MTRLRTLRNGLLSLALLIALAACLPSRGQDGPEIVRGVIGGQEYFVPRAYLKLPSRRLADDSIYVLAFYPDFRPAWDSHNSIWRDGLWKYKVRILATHSDTPAPIAVHAQNVTSLLNATERVGNEHGLVRFTQPIDKVKDRPDVWIEYDPSITDAVISYVTCSEKLIDKDNPQCAMYFNWHDSFFVKTSFDMELLPRWKEIFVSTTSLLNSFLSEEEAISTYISKPKGKPTEEE